MALWWNWIIIRPYEGPVLGSNPRGAAIEYKYLLVNILVKIVISLTTIPSRLSCTFELGFKSCILSLLNQDTNKDYEIHLNVPKVNKKTNESYIIPEYLLELAKTNNKLKIFTVEEDLGSITKLFYTINRLTDPEDIIIVCDDDLVYHPKMVDEQVKNQELYPNTAVGYDGLRAERDNGEELFHDVRDHYVVSVYRNVYVNILQAYKTVSYRRKFFKEDYEEFIKLGSWADDVTNSAYLGKHGIKKLVTFHESDEVLLTEEDWRSKGGVTTFPVLSHTHHEQKEGCNLFRYEQKDDNHGIFHKMGFLK